MFFNWFDMQREEIQLLVISFSIVLLTLLLTVFILFFFFQKKKTKFLTDKLEAELLFQSELTKSKIPQVIISAGLGGHKLTHLGKIENELKGYTKKKSHQI